MNMFSNVATGRTAKAAFNLSHEKKITCDMGALYPIYLQEVIPGDQFRVNSEIFLRMAPTLAPLMHRLNVTTHFFYVPNRIVWTEWQDFITGGEDGNAAPVFPTVTMPADTDYFKKKSLADYFGLPIGTVTAGNEVHVNALPFRAYQKIYNEYYRDQNLQAKLTEYSNSGPTSANSSLCGMRFRNWEKDYLTSALPFAQKGSPISAPIGISYKESYLLDSNGDPSTASGNLSVDSQGRIQNDSQPLADIIANIDPESTGIDINELRKAVRLQEWLEKNAHAGSRYVESIMAHFDERVPDYTAQRPVFLGGGKQPVSISEVLSTYTNTADSIPQGNMSGHGVSIGSTNRFKHRFSEHGFVIGIMSILPRTAYQQGMERFWLYRDKFDLYWPEFAQLGEQEVYDAEAYYDLSVPLSENQTTFGYQGRYNHMKYRNSQVAGDFRDNLSFWHMGRVFSSKPALNSSFVTALPRKDIFAVEDPDVNNLYVQIFNNVKAIRRMPYHNVPTL